MVVMRGMHRKGLKSATVRLRLLFLLAALSLVVLLIAIKSGRVALTVFTMGVFLLTFVQILRRPLGKIPDSWLVSGTLAFLFLIVFWLLGAFLVLIGIVLFVVTPS